MNKFKTLFNVVSKENAEATTIPVVLELDVKPAEGQADVAADPAASEPAAEPATDAPVDSGTENLDTTAVKIDEVVTQEPAAATIADAPAAAPAAQPAAPAAPVQPAQEPVASEPAAEPAVVEEPVEVSVEDEVALAEAEAEKNELVNEAEVVDDTIEKVESDVKDIGETLEANDKIIAEGGEDQINAANVAIATQSLELRLERLGLNLSDLSSSANITKETFVAKENGGLGLKPSEVLRNLHNDFAREDGILDKMKKGAKAVWDAILATIKKIFNFFKFNDDKQIAKLQEIKGRLSTTKQNEAIEIQLDQIAPAYGYLESKANKNFQQIFNDIKNQLGVIIATNNAAIKAINWMNTVSKERKWKEAVLPGDISKNLIDESKKSIGITVDGIAVSLILKNKLVGFDTESASFRSVVPQVDKSVIKMSTSKDVITLIDLAIKLIETKKPYKNEIGKMINNMEKIISDDSILGKISAVKSNYDIKSFYSQVATNIEKSVNDFSVVIEQVAREYLKNAKPDESKQLENKPAENK